MGRYVRERAAEQIVTAVNVRNDIGGAHAADAVPAAMPRRSYSNRAPSITGRTACYKHRVTCHRTSKRRSQAWKNTNQTTLRIRTASPVETVKSASTDGPGSA